MPLPPPDAGSAAPRDRRGLRRVPGGELLGLGIGPSPSPRWPSWRNSRTFAVFVLGGEVRSTERFFALASDAGDPALGRARTAGRRDSSVRSYASLDHHPQ